MARIDYFAIEEEIAELIRSHPDFSGCQVLVEEELIFGADAVPWVGVYLDRRDAQPNQSLAAGTRTRMLVSFSIWVWVFGLDAQSALKQRDEYVGKLELVLMQNRTLNDKVDMSWIEGGELPSARVPDSAGFTSGGEVVLKAEVTAIIE